MNKYTIGLDYGTDSVRAIIVDLSNGEEIATSVFSYPRWKRGLYCRPEKNQFRQHPGDYIEGLESTVTEVLSKAPDHVRSNVIGISIDTTGSTPVAVNERNIPLALLTEFEENPNAMFILWKDHTSVQEAEDINTLAHRWETDYTKYVGGIYSSEWFWAKILHVLRNDKQVFNSAYSWVEHCDWLPALLTGNDDPLKIKRSRCAAGHKAMWHETFNGLPSEAFLRELDPKLAKLRNRLYTETFTCDEAAGNLSAEWAERLGLSTDVVIGTGAFDAHIGAVGSQIEPFYLTKVMGTSTCDMLIAPNRDFENKFIAGISGQVDGSVVPGMLGMEAGQSAFGDIYNWFKGILMWPVQELVGDSGLINMDTRDKLTGEVSGKLIAALSDAAELVPFSTSGPLAVDWMNGRRTPDANPLLKGAITGLSLGTDAPAIFRALVEATVFGSKAIVERFLQEGVPIRGVIALGGVAKKSSLVMQIMADVLNMPLKVVKSEETCALGAAMAASVAAGYYQTIEEAQQNLGSGFEKTYTPIEENVRKYEKLYDHYTKLGGFIEDTTEAD